MSRLAQKFSDITNGNELEKSWRRKFVEFGGDEFEKSWRRKFPDVSSEELEKSWRSLDLFNFSHSGRLCAGTNFEDEIRRLGFTPSDGGEGIESTTTAEESDPSFGDFIIPELPEGKLMNLKIKSTWGDPYFVGLNGIEIFSDSGIPAKIIRIEAHPSSVREVLPAFANDPRVVSNLVDGIYRTRDDVHLWLAPFSGGKIPAEKGENRITIEFKESYRIAMIRIWVIEY